MSLNGLGPCARCGINPARGWAQIGDDWYCHPDFGDSCYQTQVISDALGLDPDVEPDYGYDEPDTRTEHDWTL